MTFHEIRERAPLVRALPLDAVLLATGAQQDLHDKAKWHTAQGVLSVTGTKFMNWSHGVGGGGAIDLAMHLNNLGFKAAVEWLWERFPGPPPPKRPEPAHKPTLHLPTRDDRKLASGRRYLAGERGLAPCLLDPLIEAGSLYADNHANAVFLLIGKGAALLL